MAGIHELSGFAPFSDIARSDVCVTEFMLGILGLNVGDGISIMHPLHWQD